MTPRRIALGAVLLSIIAALVGLLVGRSIESPADAALGAKAPPSGPITVPIERRVLSADLRIRGTLGATDSTEVTLAPSTIGSPDNVVVRAPAQGDTVNEGDVILVVGNRPVIALVGDLPMYRDLGPGDRSHDGSSPRRGVRRGPPPDRPPRPTAAPARRACPPRSSDRW